MQQFFPGDRLSYWHLSVILKFFPRFPSLRVNDNKTELFAIGPQNLVQEEFYHNTFITEGCIIYLAHI